MKVNKTKTKEGNVMRGGEKNEREQGEGEKRGQGGERKGEAKGGKKYAEILSSSVFFLSLIFFNLVTLSTFRTIHGKLYS